MKVYTVIRINNNNVSYLETCSSVKNLIKELKCIPCDNSDEEEELNNYLNSVSENTFNFKLVRELIPSDYRIIIRELK